MRNRVVVFVVFFFCRRPAGWKAKLNASCPTSMSTWQLQLANGAIVLSRCCLTTFHSEIKTKKGAKIRALGMVTKRVADVIFLYIFVFGVLLMDTKWLTKWLKYSWYHYIASKIQIYIGFTVGFNHHNWLCFLWFLGIGGIPFGTAQVRCPLSRRQQVLYEEFMQRLAVLLLNKCRRYYEAKSAFPY